MPPTDISAVIQFRSSRPHRPPDRRDITHVLTMRSGAPDAVPAEILAALTDASVFHTPLPKVGLGLVLDPAVEAALQDEGFDLVRVAPEPGTPIGDSQPRTLPLHRTQEAASKRSRHSAEEDLHSSIDRLSSPDTDIRALSAILLNAGALAVRRVPTTDDALQGLHDRLDAIETTLGMMSERMLAGTVHRGIG